MQFSDIPGLANIKSTLVGSYERNHIAHAQLFSGREGEGVLPMALAFITYLLCENKGENDSCGTCSNCQKMAKFIHPDVHFFYPSPTTEKDEERIKRSQLWREFLSEKPYGNLPEWIGLLGSENKVNQISKGDAREIIKAVSMKSFEGTYKILLIWYPESMNPTAANAILKVIEEPPENTLYLLVTYDYENIISTILSRTQIITIPSFEDKDVAEYIHRHFDVTDEQALRTSQLSKGNIREALTLLTNEQDIEFKDFQQWMRACFISDNISLVKLSEEFAQKTRSHQRMSISFAMDLIRNSILLKDAPELVYSEGEERTFIERFSKTFEIAAFEKMYKEFNDTLNDLGRNANPRITHLALSIRLADIFKEKKV